MLATNFKIIEDDDDVATQVMHAALLTYLVWDMVKVKEDVKCGKILHKGALCTFPIYDRYHNYDNNNNYNNNKKSKKH